MRFVRDRERPRAGSFFCGKSHSTLGVSRVMEASIHETLQMGYHGDVHV